MNKFVEPRRRMSNYGNLLINRKNSINSKETVNSYNNVNPNTLRKNERNISEIKPVIYPKSRIEDKTTNFLQKKDSYKFDTTFTNKNLFLSDFPNNDNSSLNNPKFRVLTSKGSYSTKKQNNDHSETVSNKTSISIPSNNLQKVYFSCVGLDNLGNTCYMNTSLQCLIHSSKFIPKFVKEITTINVSKETTAYQFFYLINKILLSCQSIVPSEFKSFFSKKHKLFSGYSQHDSQEFLRHLLEDISLDMNRVKKMPSYKELDTKNKSKIKLNEEFHKLFTMREDSPILDVFQGQFCNTFECENCKFKTFSFEKFIDIPILLDVNNIRNSLNLESLLNKHFKDDRFEWNSKCESCNKKTFHKKRTRISILPDVFIISFQRYNYLNNRKNNAAISFSEDLNISDYVDNECASAKNNIYNYKLYAISNHSGSLNFGHYYAYCKVNGDWKEFNDSMVRNIGYISTNTDTVYVLFYEKIM